MWTRSLEWVSRVLPEYGLNLSEAKGVTEMRGGIEADVVRVALPRTPVIVRRYKRSLESEVAFECAILEELGGRLGSISTPKLLRTLKGGVYLSDQGRLVIIYEYLRGQHPSGSSAQLVSEVCTFALRLQAFNFRSIQQERFVPIEASHHCRSAIAMFRVSNEHGDFDQELPTETFESAERFQEILKRFPLRVIHGDLHYGNLLTSVNGTLSAVVDFGDSCKGPSILEFAGIVRGHCFDNEGEISVELVQQVYSAAGDLTSHCNFDEFLHVVRMLCLRNAIRLYESLGLCSTEAERIKTINGQLYELRRWMGLQKATDQWRRNDRG